MRSKLRGLIVICLFLCASLPVLAQEAPQTDMDAMMMAMAKAGEVGPQHKALAKAVGTFDVDLKMWMDPSAEAMNMKGVAERAMMLGGRVMVETFQSDFMGQEFHGYGLTGYDNVDQEWWGTWCDTMSTAIAVMKGECSDDGTSCTFRGTYKDPLTKAESKTRFVTNSMEGGDKEVMVSYMELPDGNEMKTMELIYTRRK